jgi:hypothetical protein
VAVSRGSPVNDVEGCHGEGLRFGPDTVLPDLERRRSRERRSLDGIPPALRICMETARAS